MRIAYIVIFSDQILNIKQEETRLLLNGIKIGKRKRSYKTMWGITNSQYCVSYIFLIILIKFLLTLTFFLPLSKNKNKNLATRTKILVPPLMGPQVSPKDQKP
jgi:hypothetical protein